jgi:P-type Ca2+ transporter type 2C
MMAVDKFTPQMQQRNQLNGDHWHAIAAEEVLERLGSFGEHGLTNPEAQRRLAAYGPNQLTEAPTPTFWQMLWSQLNNFVVILLVIAALISAILGDYIEAIVILAIVVLNSALGVVQESRAEQALAALRKLAAPDAHIIRDGSRQIIPASQVVPGDLVLLEAGNYIPADVRLLEAINLRIEEAALTGESVPVQKDATARLEADIPIGDRKNTAFMGTLVSYGRGKGIVVSTGMHTQIGMIAEMLQAVEHEATPLQRRLDQLGKTLGWGALTICALVFLVGFFRGHNPLDMFIIAVSLAIAAVPEGLPAVVTISLALGMREMIKRHALIRRLSSVETLGAATVICSDKTGTLTQNEMTATHMWVDSQLISITGQGYTPQGQFFNDNSPIDLVNYPAARTALWVAALNNDAGLEVSGSDDSQPTYRMVGDPTEGALLVAASKAGTDMDALNLAYPRCQEIPFDSGRKRMVTIHKIHDPHPEDISPIYSDDHRQWYAITVKGAPDLVLNLCSHYQHMDDHYTLLDEAVRQRILDANDSMTQDALRVLGMAYRIVPELPDIDAVETIDKDLVFVGMIGMIDPPRPEVSEALSKGRHAGIRTVMITGDYPNTARAIAESIGLMQKDHQVLTGSDINRMDDAALKRAVTDTDVFARVSPEHKLRIVEALRANQQVVAMTGDGVNDAPSIKRADIGVAMGITGTDVAKESSDMVLTDDNYASIVSAVEQGRIIYDNIRKFVFFLLSSNVAEIMVIFLATLAGLPTPLTAIQLLWLNLITDGAPALALAMEKGDPDTMDRPPRPVNESIINGSMGLGITIQTLTQTLATLLAFVLGLIWYLDQNHLIPPGANPFLFLFQFNWQAADALVAETMAFVTLSLCELFRAYTVRSEKQSIFRIGLTSNRYMQYAVGLSIAALLIVVSVSFLQPIFNTTNLTWQEWGVVVGLALIPAISEEITKVYLRWRDSRHNTTIENS